MKEAPSIQLPEQGRYRGVPCRNCTGLKPAAVIYLKFTDLPVASGKGRQ